MSGTNDFLAFATGGSANVETQAAYLADAARPIGNTSGIASSSFNNKALRQACYIASQVAQFLCNQTGQNVLDDATPANIQALMTQVWPSPTGAILAFGSATAPTGFLNCDGASYLRATYPALFAVIGTTFGSADGTHFNVPNLQGVFLRGSGSQTIGGIAHSATLGATSGDTFQGHYHGTAYGSATGGSSAVFTATAFTGTEVLTTATFVLAGPPVSDGTNGTPRTGAETSPANVGVNHIIKT